MKLILISMFLLLSNLCSSQTDKKITSFFKNNYKFQYPEYWRLDTSGRLGEDFFIFSPLENKTDKFSENVNGIIQDLSGQNIDLEKYKKITEKQLSDMPADGKIYESSIINRDKKKYFKIIYAMTQGIFRLKITSICYIKNDSAYLVTFTSELSKYEQYKKVGEGILSSFYLTK